MLAQVRRTGNSGGYLPALIKCQAECVRDIILARADAYVEAFAGVPCDTQAEKDLARAAEEIAAGSISGIRGRLKLRSVRLRIAEEGQGIPWHLEIERAMHSALEEGDLRLERQRIKAKAPEPANARASSSLGRGADRVGVTRPLNAISADLERRSEAQKDLKQALQNYVQNLSQAEDLDLSALAEIWGGYAVRLYDSLAESFIGLLVSREATFGDAGLLAGGQTLEDVKKALNTVRLPRPEHWPPAQTSRGPDDDPRLAQFVRKIMFSEVSFGWLRDDPWFWNEIRDRVRERVRQWMDSSTKPDRLHAISDLGVALKRISPEDPGYKVWEAFCRASHKIEAQWISDAAGRALEGKPLDPSGAFRFVLNLFDTAVEAQVALVTDTESAAACEAELRMLASRSPEYFETLLTGTYDGQRITEWRSKLELELLHRLGKAKERALDAARQTGAGREPEQASLEKQPAAPRVSHPPATAEAGAVPVSQVPAPMNPHKPAKRKHGKGPKNGKQVRLRGETRSAWLDSRRAEKEWTSDLEIEAGGGPTYNTIRRYRGGTKSTRDAYVRQKLAATFGCPVAEVPE